MQESYVKLAHLLACDLRKRAIKVCVLALSRRNITSTLTPCQESWCLGERERHSGRSLGSNRQLNDLHRDGAVKKMRIAADDVSLKGYGQGTTDQALPQRDDSQD